MKKEYNRYERIAGLFTLIAIAGMFIATVVVVVNRGWFTSKHTYSTSLKTASGIHPGTNVQISGIKVGWVDSVELIEAGNVRVTFYIFEHYAKNVRFDSRVQIVRPYLVGEKVLEISIGDPDFPQVRDGDFIPSTGGIDMVDLLSGRVLGPLLDNLYKLVNDVSLMVEALDDGNVKESVFSALENIVPLIANMNDMSREMAAMAATANRDNRFETMLESMVRMSRDMTKLTQLVMESDLQKLSQLSDLAGSMVSLSNDMQQLMPILLDMSKDGPEMSKLAIETMNEAIITMQAMQKSFLLRGKVKDVKRDREN